MGKAFFPVAEHSGSPGNIEADLSLDGMNDNLGILRQARDPIPFAGKAREDDMIAATPAVGGLESARRAVAPGKSRPQRKTLAQDGLQFIGQLGHRAGA